MISYHPLNPKEFPSHVAAVAQGMADLMDWAMTMASMYGPPPGWEDSWEGT